MRKRFLSLLMLTFFVVGSDFLNAQTDIDINWGKLNYIEKRSNLMLIGEGTDGHVYVLKTDKKGRKYIERYDKEDLGHDYTAKIDFQLSKGSSSKKDRLDYEDVFVMDGEIIVFASNYNKKEDYFTIYARAYDYDGREASGWMKLESVYAEKKRKSGYYDIVRSKDKTKILIKHTLPSKKSQPQQYGYSVFDSKLEKLFSKEVTFSKASKRDDIVISGDRISNDGTVYFFANINSQMHFYSLDSTDDNQVNSNDLLNYEVDFNGKSIIEIASFDDNKGSVVLTGFYNDVTIKRNYGISGVVYVKLRKEDFSEREAKATAFEQEYLEKFMSSRRAQKGKGISTTFDLRHLIFNDNGTATLIAENNYVTQNCTRDPKTGVQSCTYTYHFDQLMIIGINEDGSIKYAQYLPKFAGVGNPRFGGVSYSVISVGDNIIIFYNDHFKNYRAGAKRVRALPSYKKTVLVKAVVSADGEISKEVLVRHKDIKLIICPRYTMKINNEKGLLMLGYYKKSMRMGRFVIN